jgi:hypothetical protein
MTETARVCMVMTARVETARASRIFVGRNNEA